MHTRIILVMILFVSLLGSVTAVDPPPPPPPPPPQLLLDRQVHGLLAALQDPLTERQALKWCSEIQANNGELFEPIRARCKADEPGSRRLAAVALVPFGEKAVPDLIPLLKDPDQGPQLAASKALGLIGEKAAPAVPDLITLLNNSDQKTREAAVEALGRIGEKAAAAVPDLITVLKGSDPFTQKAAAEALGRIGDKAAAAFPLLITRHTYPDPLARSAAAEALGRIGEKAVPDLITLLMDKDFNQRWAAVVAFDKIGDKAAAAVPELITMLKEKNLGIRSAAAEALGKIGDKATAAIPDLITLLKEKETLIRRDAAKALGRIGEKAASAVPDLITLLKDPDPITRREAMEALGRIGEKAASAVPDLITLLKDPNVFSSRDAAKALGGIGEKAASPVFDLRREAAEALGGIGEKAASAVPDLITLVRNKDTRGATSREAAGAAAVALGKIGEKAASAVPDLITLLNNSDLKIRQAAVEALGRIGEKAAAAVPDLIPLLKDSASSTRWAVAEALGKLGDKAVLKLITLLKDPNPFTRTAAAEALGRIGEKAAAAVPDLIPLLTAPDPNTRWAAVVALGSIGDKAGAAVPNLITLLKDPNPLTRQAAADVLRRLGDKATPAVPDLIPLLKEPVKETRQIARSVLLRLNRPQGAVPHHEIVMALLWEEQETVDRIALSDWLRRHAQVESADLGSLLEMSHQRIDERPERLLDAYLCASESERPLVRWLGGRPEKTLTPLGSLNPNERVDLLRQLTAFLPHTAATPRTRVEVARLMDVIVESTSWSHTDLDALREAQAQLQAAEMKAEADAVQKHVERLEWWRRWTERLKATSTVWAGHVVFWGALIFLYPRFRWVQAAFFWNPWVRNISGLVYVPWVITLVPFLRRRLLRPFQENLIPQRFAHEFQGDSYFAGSRISSTREGHPVTILATGYLAPPLRGPRVIEGPSGFGKTTLLQWFIQQPGGPRVVLRATECDEGVMKAIQKLLYGIAADEKFLQTLVFAGGLDVIIDGLNEASPDTRAQITTFVNSLFRGNYLITTQPLLGFKVPRAAEVWKLQPLAPDQVAAFLLQQWPRVEATATANEISRETYTTRVEELAKKAEKLDESDLYRLSTPLDAALAADLLAQRVNPKLNNLVAQHVQLARDRFREISPAQEPGFDRVGERALDQVRNGKPKLDLAGLEKECDALLQRKLLINHGDEYAFRHGRVRDYFIALSIKNVEAALALLQDARYTGVFEFLPETLDSEDANELGEKLKEEAADSGDKRVWAKYKTRWKQPKRPRNSKQTGAEQPGGVEENAAADD